MSFLKKIRARINKAEKSAPCENGAFFLLLRKIHSRFQAIEDFIVETSNIRVKAG